jgi:hypothetical protein
MQYKYKLKEVEVGDTKIEKGVKSTVKAIDPVTGAISWDVEYVADFEKLFDDATELVRTSKGVYTKSKEDSKFKEFYQFARELRNKIRTHLRNEYPEQYQDIKGIDEDIEEISTSAGAGSYLTKYAFKKPKKQKELEENIGSNLGPGPKAGPDGVKDNYYVKKFKYKLVPKDKNGNYVQKGSGLEVKNF